MYMYECYITGVSHDVLVKYARCLCMYMYSSPCIFYASLFCCRKVILDFEDSFASDNTEQSDSNGQNNS